MVIKFKRCWYCGIKISLKYKQNLCESCEKELK